MTPAGEETAPIRAEHDELARRLAARRSIDHVRRGAWAAFLLVVTGGLAAKLGWDRWGSTHPRAFQARPMMVPWTWARCCYAARMVSTSTPPLRNHAR